MKGVSIMKVEDMVKVAVKECKLIDLKFVQVRQISSK